MSALPSHIGAYEVVRLLGKGGMAVVYLGRDPAIDRLVAIKLLRESLDSVELRERFSREAKSAGRLRHPNIVTVFQVGVHDNAPFIVMEYIPGESLAEIIKRQPLLTLTWKLRVIEDLCRGLAYAHKSGIVHRDMKPANIQIDSDGGVKILDFGIARLGGEQKTGEEALTRLGMMMGTPNYMAPEQINPGTADHRSDVFAVGLVLYELLTFHRAFGGDSYAVLHNILHQEPDPVEKFCPGIEPAIVAIVNRALAKDPNARYQDLGEMRDDLRRIRLRLRAETDDLSDEGPVTSAGQTFVDVAATRLADRRTEIGRFLDEARSAYDANDFQRVIERCEQALKLDATLADAIDLANRASEQLTLAHARDLLAAGQEAYATGDLDLAANHIKDLEALQLPSGGGSTSTVQSQMSALARAVTSAIERQRALRDRLTRGRELLTTGALDDAARVVDEALGIAPGNRDVLALRTEVRAAIDAERARQRAAEDAVSDARLQAERGQFDSALALLEQHQPAHPLVTAALNDIRGLKAEADRRAAEERRRHDHAIAARDTLAAAREAADHGDLAGALQQVKSIDFTDPELASPALDRIKIEADTLVARCEAGQHLDAARAALATEDFATAAARLDQARHRDPSHPDTQAVGTAIDRARMVRDRITRGRSELERGDLETAERLTSEALTQAPNHAEAIQLRERIRAAVVEREAALQRAADAAITDARRDAERGDFAKAISRLKDHRPSHPAIAAALTDIVDQQSAAERKAADERRRQEHASRARAALRAARTAADQGDPAAALMLLQGIEFEASEVSSPALDALKNEADALIARCEAAGYLDTARAELAKGNRDAAAEAVEQARLRDASHPDIDKVVASFATETIVLDAPPPTIVASAPEATVYLARPDSGPLQDQDLPAAADTGSSEAFPPTLVQPGQLSGDRTIVLPAPIATPPPTPPSTPTAPAQTKGSKKAAKKAKEQSREEAPRGPEVIAKSAPPPMPAPVVQVPAPAPAPAARPSTTTTGAKRSSTPLIAVGAAAAVVLVGVIWWMTSGGSKPANPVVAENTSRTPVSTEAPSQTGASTSSQVGSNTPSTETVNPAPPPQSSVPAPSTPATVQPPVTNGRQTQPPTTTGRATVPETQRGATGSRATPPPQQPTPSPAQPTSTGPSRSTQPTPPPTLPNTPTPQAQTTVAVNTPPPASTESSSGGAQTPVPTPARPTAVATPPAADPARDEATIRNVIAELSAGYERMDASGIRRLWPNVPAGLEPTLTQAKSYEYTFDRLQISIRGDNATVTAIRRVRMQPKAGRAQENTAPVTLTLRRAGAGWIIDSIR